LARRDGGGGATGAGARATTGAGAAAGMTCCPARLRLAPTWVAATTVATSAELGAGAGAEEAGMGAGAEPGAGAGAEEAKMEAEEAAEARAGAGPIHGGCSMAGAAAAG
jgi:hypothetical protein